MINYSPLSTTCGITVGGTGLSTITGQLYVGSTADYFGSSTVIQLISGASNKNVGIRSNILYLYSYNNGSTAQLVFGDGSANFGLFSNDTEFALYNYGTASNSITVNRSTNNATFAGDVTSTGIIKSNRAEAQFKLTSTHGRETVLGQGGGNFHILPDHGSGVGISYGNTTYPGLLKLYNNTTAKITLDASAGTGDFTGNVTAPSFSGTLQGAVTGAPDATIWRVSGQYPTWGIFYDEGNPDLIQFKSSGNTKATISLDNGDYTGRSATFTGTVKTPTLLVNATAVRESASKLSVQGGMSEFETTLSNGNDWANSPISILERGNIGSGSSDDKYSPNLNFHWNGRVSNSLWMSDNGHLNWGSYTSGGVPAADGVFRTQEIYLIGTGRITGVDTVSANTDAANKAYVDAHVSPAGTYLPLIGGTMSGNIAMGDNDITGIDQLTFSSGTYLTDVSSNYVQLRYASADAGGIIVLDGDGTTQGYLYSDGGATSSFGLLDGTGSWAVRCLENQYVELNYDNAVKLRTATGGINVTGAGNFTGSVISTDGTDTATLSKTGLILSRSNSYIQSDADNSDTLNIGQSSVRWGNVKVDSATFKVLNGGNERLGIDSSGNATFAGSVDVGTFTLSGSGIIADAGMTLQTNAGGVNAIALASNGNATFAGNTSALAVTARDNLFVDAGQLYIGADNGSTDGTFRQVVNIGAGTFTLQKRISGTFTNVLSFDNSNNATFSGVINLSSNKSVAWPGGSIRAEGNTLKLVATTLIDLQDNTQVQGSVKIAEASNKGQLFFGTANTDYEIKGGGNYGYLSLNAPILRFDTGGTERMRITASGMKLSTSGATVSVILDEDNMASDSATALATQQSIKAYVDNSISGGANYLGVWDPDDSLNNGYGNPSLQASGRTDDSGDYFICSADGAAHPNGGTTEPDSWHTGDWVVWNEDLGSSGLWQKIDNTTVLSGGGTTNKLPIFTDSETIGDSRFSQNSTTNIITGPGNTASDYSLSIRNAGNTEQLYIHGTGEVVVTQNYFYVASSQGMYSNGTARLRNGITNDQSVLSLGGNGSVGNLTLTSNTSATFAGNVGIGETSPTSKLSIKGAQAAIDITRGTTGDSKWEFSSDSTAMYIAEMSTGTRDYIMTLRETSGNVGIGTTNPQNLLHIQGDTYHRVETFFDGSYTSGWKFSDLNGGIKYDAGSDNLVVFSNFTGTGAKMTFETQGSEKMRIDSSGNVGIGTTSPDMKLDVAGNIRSRVASNTAGGFYIGEGDTAEAFGLLSQGANGYFKIRDVYNSADRFYISNTGNVGIGTDNPGAKLEVRSDGSAAGGAEIRLQHANNNTNDVVSTVNFANNAGSVGMIQAGTAGANNTGYIALFTDIAGSSSERMRVHTNGNVGIGTTLPIHPLYVNGDIGQSDGSRIWFRGSSSSSGTGAQSYVYSNGLNLQIKGDDNVQLLGDGGGVIAHFDYSGNVGIGTTNPVEKLQINSGDVLINNSTVSTLKSGGSLYIDLNTFGSYSGRNFRISDNGTSLVNVTQVGNVGIGTTGPTQKLDTPNIVIGGSSIAANYRANSIMMDNLGGIARFYSLGPNTTTGGSYQFNSLSSNATAGAGAVMTILNNGNVGIGVTNPTDKLRVEGSIRTNSSGDGEVFFGTGSLNKIVLDGTDMEFWSGGLDASITMSNQGLIKFGLYGLGGTGTPTALLGVDNSGNVVKTTTAGDLPGGPYLPLAGGTMTGNIDFGGTTRARFGSSAQLQILFSSHGYIHNTQGDLELRNYATDGDIRFMSDNGSGGEATYFTVDGANEVTSFQKDSKHEDNIKAYFGNASDLSIYHDGSNSFIDESGTGNLYIRSNTIQIRKYTGEDMITCLQDNAVTLYYDNAPKLATTSAGIAVTGSISTTEDISVSGDLAVTGTTTAGGTLICEGNITVQDSDKLQLGNSQDLELYHAGGVSYIDNDTGHLYIRNNVDNDDGSNIYIQAKSGENSIICNDDSSVVLYNNNSAKFYTTTSGVGALGYIGFGSAGTSTGTSYGFRYGSSSPSGAQGIVISVSDTGGAYFDGVGRFQNTNTGQGAGMFQMVNYGSLYGRYMQFFRGSTSNIIGYIGYNSSNTSVTFSTTNSDIRTKKNITTWNENVLDKFKALQPKRFDFKVAIGDKGAVKERGFIAQYEKDNFPEAYQLNGNDEKATYGFHPMEMVPYMMKAIKDLTIKNEELERRIKTLES